MDEKNKKANETDPMESKIAKWKEQYGSIFAYEVETEVGKKQTLYFKQANRRIIAAANAHSNGDSISHTEFVLKNCLLEGDPEMLNNDSVFFGLAGKSGVLIDAAEGELKKL